jgi:hypothetical protein
MPVRSSASRRAGRAVGAAVIVRSLKRYPIVVLVLFCWRWARRRASRVERTTVRLRADETITLQEKRG